MRSTPLYTKSCVKSCKVVCWTPIRKTPSDGPGRLARRRPWGDVSTNVDSHIAFGGTEKRRARVTSDLTLGCKPRGTADQAPFDNATGAG